MFKIDQRKIVEKMYQITSVEELKIAMKENKDIYLEYGEAFSGHISWFGINKADFFISEEGHEDVHNSGPDVLCVKRNGRVVSSYSYVDKKGYFRRRQGHEHITRVMYKVMEPEPLISKVDGGYVIAGNIFTEREILDALKIC